MKRLERADHIKVAAELRKTRVALDALVAEVSGKVRAKEIDVLLRSCRSLDRFRSIMDDNWHSVRAAPDRGASPYYTQPSPHVDLAAETQVTVVHCEDCPFKTVDGVGDFLCSLARRGCAPFDTCGPPPKWCPLRERSTVVWLKQADGEAGP